MFVFVRARAMVGKLPRTLVVEVKNPVGIHIGFGVEWKGWEKPENAKFKGVYCIYGHSSHQSCYLIGTPHPQIYEQLCVGSSYHIYSMWLGHGTYMAPAFRCDNARHLLRHHWPTCRCSNHLFEFKWNRDFNGMIMMISDGDHHIVDVSISSNMLSFHRESIAPVYQAGMTQAGPCSVFSATHRKWRG